MTSTDYRTARLDSALQSPDASLRLRAALAAGSGPMPADVPVLIAHCGTEPDFFVRDMLTWALTRHDPALTVAAVLPQLRSASAQARSQALHTLSKIGDPATGAAITVDLLHDENVEVARAAWRTAAGLVPAGHEAEWPRNWSASSGGEIARRNVASVARSPSLEPLLRRSSKTRRAAKTRR